MLFNSYIFIFLFLPIVILGFIILRRHSTTWPIAWITCISLFYYGWWKPQFLILLIFSITVNLIFGKLINQYRELKTISKTILILGIVFNLGLLAYFKYAGFFVANFNDLFKTGFPLPHILLPIGISFITFQKIAFLVDAHRGLVRNFTILNYIFFVTFFPQLIAGPIVHHAEIMPQLASVSRRNIRIDFSIGISIFIIGLFKKVVIADGLSIYADAGYSMLTAGHTLNFISAWITVISYSLQLYFDFSAYSDMAIGLGRMFGIRLPLNFYSPYKATSIIDFWRRWHMTLSRFLRDYLYIPLGGNQKGFIRRYLNLIIVMLLGGLWHGANWTFAIWGGVHGILLILNHAWRQLPFTHHRYYQIAPIRMIGMMSTFILVTLAWIPFRAETMSHARNMLSYLLPNSQSLTATREFLIIQVLNPGSFNEWFKPRELWPPVLPPDYLTTMARPVGVILTCCILIVFFMPNTSQLFRRFEPALGIEIQPNSYRGALKTLNAFSAMILAMLFSLAVLMLSHVSPFLYFQF